MEESDDSTGYALQCKVHRVLSATMMNRYTIVGVRLDGLVNCYFLYFII
uniref:Uncharacterized protein n=1 Tax=Arundo donax TaxID=35708 RepID=A0A0A8Z151_ARUDO